MRIILDESVPQKLRLLIEGHTVVTAWYQGWSGLQNGALLDAAEQAGFELFITADQAMGYRGQTRKVGADRSALGQVIEASSGALDIT
jgi:hypothetical protein